MAPFKPTSGLTRGGVRRVAETEARVAPGLTESESGLTAKGVRRIAEVEAAPLSTQQRKSLPKSDFVFPNKAPGPGSYPIDTRGRGANALSRSSGKPEEGAVKRAVCSRYPDLPECKGSK